MNKYLLVFCFAFVITLFACNKDKSNGNIQIRVLNATLLPLSNLQVGDNTYGSLAPKQTSAYKNFTGTIYAAPKISFNNNKDTVEYVLGICGTPLPPPLPNGRYTYTITRDVSTESGFAFDFTKN